MIYTDKILDFIKTKYHYIVVLAFSMILGFTFFFSCDDYVWYFVYDYDKLASYRSPNGRYISNFLIRKCVNYPFLFLILFLVSFILLIYIVSKLNNIKKNYIINSTFIVVALLLLLPHTTFKEVFRWMSGYINYGLGLGFTLLYLNSAFRLIFDKCKPSFFNFPLFFIFGIFNCLFVEHLTIYNILFSLFIVLFLIFKERCVSIHHISYFLGAIFAAIIMFSNNVYSSILSNEDTLAPRAIELDFSDVYSNIYRFLISHFAKDYTVVHLILVASFSILYYKKKMSASSKYSLVTLLYCFGYLTYSFFSSFFTDIAMISPSLKGRAIETAITFIYLCCIIYNIHIYFNGNIRIKCFIYLFSTIICTAPFAVVSPITPRCFFVEYFFWILLCTYIWFNSVCMFAPDFYKLYNKFTLTISIVLVIFVSNICITNFYYNNLRFDFIAQQISSGEKNIKLIVLPYDDYAFDDFNDSSTFSETLDNNVSYGELIFMYYNVPKELYDTLNFSKIGVIDYYEVYSE